MMIEGMFDIEANETSRTQIPLNIPDLNAKPWNIGLIYGPSGSGKSTVARQIFGQELEQCEALAWSKTGAIVDDFPTNLSIKEITELLSSVGFSSPPSWLRPYSALSNGEQFRVSLARVLAENPELAIVDEFTSVVDRTVARVGSHAIAKTVRRRNQKFVAVSCHSDILEWLQPDWTYEPASGQFRWESLQQRPKVDLQIVRANSSAWNYFARHHYLDHSLNKSAAVYLASVEDQPAAIACVLAFPHPNIKSARRVSRIVVTPDFQGLGLANHVLDALGGGYKALTSPLYISTSHPALVASLNRRPTWAMAVKPSRRNRQGATSALSKNAFGTSSGRITTSFRYCGPSRNEIVPLIRG
jgi:ABC-type lipoprotein export system ATPase subunit